MRNTMKDRYDSIKDDIPIIIIGILKIAFRIGLVVFVVLLFVPGFTFCDSKIGIAMKLNENGQEYTLEKYNNAALHVTVPASHKGKPVTIIGEKAFADCTMLTDVTIPDSVAIIGPGAFSGCTNLKNIRIPNNVLLIADEAFSGCTSLSSAYIGNGVMLIGKNVFFGCANLTSISVDYTNQFYRGGGNCIIDKKNGRLIAGCKRSVIPGGVTSIGRDAFYKCGGLYSIEIPSGVKDIEASAFYQSGLWSIKIPNSVTDIGDRAFAFCDSLTGINISASVKRIGPGAFFDCPSLISIKVDPSNTKYRSEGNCLIETATNKLILGSSNSVIPSGVTTIGDNAFYGRRGLASITIPVSVTNIESGAFVGCTALSDITFEGTKEHWRQIEKENGWSSSRYMNKNTPATAVHCSDGDVSI